MNQNSEQKNEVLEFLAKQDQDTVQEAIQEILDPVITMIHYKEFEDIIGEEVRAGAKNVRKKEDLSRYERIIQEPNFLEAHFLEEGAIRQRAVARIV